MENEEYRKKEVRNPVIASNYKCAFLDNQGSQRLLVEMHIIIRVGETNKKGGKESPALKSAPLRFLILKSNR